jgi:tRNA U55 pseudouridine synthase TruB
MSKVHTWYMTPEEVKEYFKKFRGNGSLYPSEASALRKKATAVC